MFHGFDYPDEIGKNEFGVRLCHQRMEDGIINFTDPRKIRLRRVVSTYGNHYSYKCFEEGVNFKIELV